jgi:hypothetical protein
MTSALCPPPSAPVLTNRKIQPTRHPRSKDRPEIYPLGALIPHLETLPKANVYGFDLSKKDVDADLRRHDEAAMPKRRRQCRLV